LINSQKAHDLAESKFKKRQEQLKEGEKAYAEYLAEQHRVEEKTARLRALRLARDAAVERDAASAPKLPQRNALRRVKSGQ
jgi:hypothetical protein